MDFLFSFDFCYSFVTLISIITVCLFWFLIKSFLPKRKVSGIREKYVLITGCDSGFGRRTAIRLDQLGFNVFASCLTNQGKENIQESCSDRVVGFVMDVTDSEQIQNVYEEVKKIVQAQGLWAVVNNAGYMTLGPLEWFKLEEYKRMADVNLWGLIDVTKTFLPLVKKAKGRIVNFASIAGLVCPAGFAPYSITKYAVEAFSDALRREMAQWGVKVCIMEPQAFKTPLLNDITEKKLESLWEGITTEMKEEYGREFFEKYKASFIEIVMKGVSGNLDLVVNDVIDALTTCDPQPRYLIGDVAKSIGLLALFPTKVQDCIIKPL